MVKYLGIILFTFFVAFSSINAQSISLSKANDLELNEFIIRPGSLYKSKVAAKLNEKVKSKKGSIDKDGVITYASHCLTQSRIKLITNGMSKGHDYCTMIQLDYCGNKGYQGDLNLFGLDIHSDISSNELIDSPQLRRYITFDFSTGKRPKGGVRLRLKHYEVYVVFNIETDKLETVRIEQMESDDFHQPPVRKTNKS